MVVVVSCVLIQHFIQGGSGAFYASVVLKPDRVLSCTGGKQKIGLATRGGIFGIS